MVACGHEATASAAADILRDGGNAVDAAIAGFFAACFAEPVLCSLGGSGFAMVGEATGTARLLDFFSQTPAYPNLSNDLDFERVDIDFGSATQHFYIGNATVAVPGAVSGIFELHKKYASMPMHELSAPALDYARGGATLTAQQAKVLKLVEPIYTSRTSASRQFTNDNGDILSEGDVLEWADLIQFVESLVHGGSGLFYHGDFARKIVSHIQQNGGHLTYQDFTDYRVQWKQPMVSEFRDNTIAICPSPSIGGGLIWLALELLSGLQDETLDITDELLASVMHKMNVARTFAVADNANWPDVDKLTDSVYLQQLRNDLENKAKAWRGTTHISVSDNSGMSIGITLSNGEGCGEIIPQTGLMLNNMLGEPDVNPAGQTGWPLSTRLSSMMSPCMVQNKNGDCTVLGSGGSSRIRSAVLQVIINLCARGDTLESAIIRPRFHLEDHSMNIEGGMSTKSVHQLKGQHSDYRCFDGLDFYFGGVHATRIKNGILEGFADPRRDGVCIVV